MLKLKGSCLAGRSSLGSIAAMFSSSTRNTAAIRRRSTRDARAVRAVDAARPRTTRQPAPPGAFRSRRSSAPSTWRSRSGATATSPPSSIRSAAVRRSAIRRFWPRPTASPTTICAACRRTSSPVRSTASTTAYDAIEALRRIYLLDDRLRLRARVRARGARVAAAGGRAGTVPRAGRSDRSRRAARPAVAGRGVRALPPPHVPGQDALLDRRARHARADPRRGDRRGGRGRHPADPDRHGAPRPPERDGARAEQAVRADPRRVQGSRLAQLPRGHGVDRRRQVPRRRAPRDQGRRGDGSRRVDAAQPEPPRGGRSGRRGHGARGGHERRTVPARRGSIRRAACRS